MNVLVLAPHPDDEAIGCGGTIARHSDQGDRVVVVFLTSGELGLKHLAPEQAREVRECEAEQAAGLLGVAALEFLRQPDWLLADHLQETSGKLHAVLRREVPDRIYLPHAGDGHPDHRACAALDLSIPGIAPASRYGYEVWTPLADFDLVKDVTSTMHRKLLAVRCYRSQLQYRRYDRAVRGLNAYRGALAGPCRYAEVFASITEGGRP